MTLSDLASIGSLVSGVAVLVSLIYLAQQTRQNSRHTRALIQQGRASQGQAGIVQWIATDPSTAEVYLRGCEGDVTLDRVQFIRFFYMMISAFFAWEDSFYQHREDLVENERHAAMMMTIKTILQGPGAIAAWQMGRTSFGADFQSFVDGLLSEASMANLPSRDPFEIWKSLLPA
jgi:hypothetical protein